MSDPVGIVVEHPVEGRVTQGLAYSPRILDDLSRDLSLCGVVGEDKIVRLLFLALTSRLLDRPVSVAVKGPSAGGKSFLIDTVLSFFSPEAYHALTAMSERALAYSDEPLRHRFLVLFEAAGMGGDMASYLMRSLLSEGRLRYEYVDKTLKPKLIEKEGPTGLIVSTTNVRLHPENETRLLSVVVSDTTEQTQGVLRRLASGVEGDVDRTRWLRLQLYLEGGEHRVTVPYAATLADMVPPVAVRLRRDFGAVLNLVKTHALLHQATRDRDGEGRVVASLDDYGTVRDIVADIVAEGVEATVPGTVRETVSAVETMGERLPKGVTVAALATTLSIDKSAASRRARTAIDQGYIVNLETQRGRPARLKLGEPLPDDLALLPPPEAVADRCSVAPVPEERDMLDWEQEALDLVKRELGATEVVP